MAKGLFYWYFENKEALFRELVEHNRLQLRLRSGTGMDPAAEPLSQPSGCGGVDGVHVDPRPFLRAARGGEPEKQFSDVLRRGTEIHAADMAALVREGIDIGTIRDEDPLLLAYGVVGAVGYYGHFHRTGRVALPVAELAAVRRPVRRVLAGRRRARSPGGSWRPSLRHRRPEPEPGVGPRCTWSSPPGAAGSVPSRARGKGTLWRSTFLSDEWSEQARRSAKSSKGKAAAAGPSASA